MKHFNIGYVDNITSCKSHALFFQQHCYIQTDITITANYLLSATQ